MDFIWCQTLPYDVLCEPKKHLKPYKIRVIAFEMHLYLWYFLGFRHRFSEKLNMIGKSRFDIGIQ